MTPAELGGYKRVFRKSTTIKAEEVKVSNNAG
jgi:hypothetical protein